MPITYEVDHTRGIVLATGHGTLTDTEVFGYQREVWSRPEVAGFDELIDMSDVESIDLPSAQRVRDLAALSAQMDGGASPSLFVIVAGDEIAFRLGRLYKAHRELEPRGTRQVAVFRTLAEARAFLESARSGR